MKKLYYIFILAIPLFLSITSCTKTSTDSVIGKWLTIRALTTEFDENGVQIGNILNREISLTDSLYQVQEFKSDGTRVVTKVLGNKINSTYTINNSVITIIETGKPVFEADYYFLNHQLFMLAEVVTSKKANGATYISKKVHCIYSSAY